MQTFYVVIEKDKLMLYEKNGDLFDKVYLSGKPDFLYSINTAKYDIEKLLKILVEEYNLDSISELEIIVIDNENDIISKALIEMFGNTVVERINIQNLIYDVLQKLSRDEKMRILEYGINFDGKKYIISEEKIIKDEFSLLAYTLNSDMLMKYARR